MPTYFFYPWDRLCWLDHYFVLCKSYCFDPMIDFQSRFEWAMDQFYFYMKMALRLSIHELSWITWYRQIKWSDSEKNHHWKWFFTKFQIFLNSISKRKSILRPAGLTNNNKANRIPQKCIFFTFVGLRAVLRVHATKPNRYRYY